MKKLLIPFAVLAIATTAVAQDTGGVSQTTDAGTIVKGKAPVAKEILKVKFPSPQSFRLKNGLIVYVLEDHRLPAVRLTLRMRAGSIYESKPGVAAATASMLTDGTTSKTYLQIADETESIGANLNANAAVDTATLTAGGLSESTDEILALMSDVLLHPSFPADRLARYQTTQRNGQSQRRTNPTAMIAELQGQLFYGGTPYARPNPTPEEVRAITTADLSDFYKMYYRPDGAILGVTGDVNPKTLRSKLDALFKDWMPAGKVAALPAADFKPKTRAHIYLIDRPGSAQSVLQFSSLAVKQTDSDYLALTVANRILGGGSSGRLFQNIREKKGYTYGAYSTLAGGKWPGIWGANASVRTEVTAPAVGEFFNEFKRLQTEPVPADELALAKRSMIGGFARTLENPEGILQRTLELVDNGQPLNYWDTYPAKIAAVTPEEIMRVAKKYLGGGNIQLMVVGERKNIEDGLSKYGTVELIDPAKIGTIGSR